MSSFQSSVHFPPHNYSLHAIPIAYALAFPPALYQFTKGMLASNYAATNIIPRTNIETLKSKVPADTWQKLVRARGCHLNALEGFPLFAAAMVGRLLSRDMGGVLMGRQIVGNYAGLQVRDLNVCAAEYLVARVLYSVLYMTVKTEAASYLRSGVYAWSVGIPFYVLWNAANKIGQAAGDKL
jgi:uncharacterized MAPEG superfamily protein